ncbi:MAG: hypothetical protein BJ554DRAFT_939 [Olpidium bornovanus]|uniref:Uncharacterized protein n=1 Tax=Olpidium bornovanus TaxID=278681 RepID=A0A8H8A1I2_9FUNG|nr:MAG: hypothetical protein BJ554DRAFT_939 [Olpidium bornovanus]
MRTGGVDKGRGVESGLSHVRGGGRVCRVRRAGCGSAATLRSGTKRRPFSAPLPVPGFPRSFPSVHRTRAGPALRRGRSGGVPSPPRFPLLGVLSFLVLLFTARARGPHRAADGAGSSPPCSPFFVPRFFSVLGSPF